MSCLTCDLHNAIVETYRWEYVWENLRDGQTMSTKMGPITVLKFSNVEYDSYGDAEEQTVYMVLQLGDVQPRFFRKEGTINSYGDDIEWTGTFREVRPVEKTVTVYEWESE